MDRWPCYLLIENLIIHIHCYLLMGNLITHTGACGAALGGRVPAPGGPKNAGAQFICVRGHMIYYYVRQEKRY